MGESGSWASKSNPPQKPIIFITEPDDSKLLNPDAEGFSKTCIQHFAMTSTHSWRDGPTGGYLKQGKTGEIGS